MVIIEAPILQQYVGLEKSLPLQWLLFGGFIPRDSNIPELFLHSGMWESLGRKAL